MSNWISVGPIDQIPQLGSRVVEVGEESIAVFRTGADKIFALRDKCPHKGGPLSQGIIYGDKVACPLHNWSIDLETGEAQAPDKGCARHYEVKIEGSEILIYIQ